MVYETEKLEEEELAESVSGHGLALAGRRGCQGASLGKGDKALPDP